MLENYSRKNIIEVIPVGMYCHGEDYVCPFYKGVDNLYGYCTYMKNEVEDMCKICYDYADSENLLNEDFKGDSFRKGHVLVIVDPQNDFIKGELGSDRSMKVANKIADELLPFYKKAPAGYNIYVTQDWHSSYSLKSYDELKTFGMHCEIGSEGADVYFNIKYALDNVSCPVTYVKKETFSTDLNFREYPITITIVGFCTDICVLAMACNLRRQYPSSEIRVDPNFCCGTTEENEAAAIKVLKSMGLIIEEE